MGLTQEIGRPPARILKAKIRKQLGKVIGNDNSSELAGKANGQA